MTDILAAFNLSKKSVLISQMKIYGMNFKSRSLVHRYLSGRKTKCPIKGCMLHVQGGVSGHGHGHGRGICSWAGIFYMCLWCGKEDVKVHGWVSGQKSGLLSLLTPLLLLLSLWIKNWYKFDHHTQKDGDWNWEWENGNGK